MAALMLAGGSGRAQETPLATALPFATNLLSLRQLTQSHIRTNAGIAIEGIICEINETKGVLVLRDKSATELLELALPAKSLRAGQKIRLIADACEITRRRTGFGMRRLPLVNNDGEHAIQEKSAAVELAAARHPIAVEWFNNSGAAKLAVEFSGPGISRQVIPESALSHCDPPAEDGQPGFSPGLRFRGYDGGWQILPDFDEWPVMRTEVVSNFCLGAWSQAERVGGVFSGFLTVMQAGDYTFYLSSDDGSKLYLGEPLPRVEVLGEGAVPSSVQSHIGEITGPNNPARWVTVEGAVRYVTARAGRLELELRSPSNNRLQADVMDDAGLAPAMLLNAQVRLTGVGRQVFSAGGQSILGLLTVGAARNLQILGVPFETWVAYPRQSVTNACVKRNLKAIVHVSGKLTTKQDQSELLLTDNFGSVAIERTPQSLALSGRSVEVLGVLQSSGTNWFLSGICVKEVSLGKSSEQLALLTSAEQVLQLPRGEAARGYPVRLRGVITCVWPENYRNAVLQDSTRGIFLLQPTNAVLGRPQFGEFWEVEGVSSAGNFSPMINVRSLQRISDGRLPEPVHPEWDQLVNGSLDNQFVEIEGVVIHAEKHSLTLLAHSGKITINVFGEKPPVLEQYVNKLVRVRGCLQALWDAQTHQVKIGEVQIGNLSINADRSFSADPFAAPARQVQDLRLYDLQANAFNRVKISGQFLYQNGGEYFMVSGTHGLRFVPSDELVLHPGDLIDVVGVPDLRGATPVLREAAVRKTGSAVLPAATKLTSENLLLAENDATRVEVEGTLLNLQRGRAEQVLEMRSGLRTFVVRMPAARTSAQVFEPGSQLRLTGVYAGQSAGRDGGAVLDSFDLFVDSPADIQVLSRPPWWTFKKLLLALGMLAGVLALAGTWIVLLRRQVDRRTAQLERANRKREQAERAQVLDEERLRIARDLHDDLGSSLTEITMLGGMTLAENGNARGDTVSQIVKKARDSVNALDVIVWAVNPKENSLQSLADYLASFADEFLTASGIACRLNLPVSFPAVTLDGRTRHDLFLATKEALNNAVRHARATEVELSLALEQTTLTIGVRDNGAGFEKSAKTFGHGLGNLQSRLEKLGGGCQIDTAPGGGTTVRLRLGLAL
jgi:signal transduction histidine kinase